MFMLRKEALLLWVNINKKKKKGFQYLQKKTKNKKKTALIISNMRFT